jgi:hypothetical protein
MVDTEQQQQLSAVAALLVAVHLLWWIQNNNSNCLLWQRCWLLCTCYGGYRAERKCADLKRGEPPGFFIPLREQLC